MLKIWEETALRANTEQNFVPLLGSGRVQDPSLEEKEIPKNIREFVPEIAFPNCRCRIEPPRDRFQKL